MSKFILWTDAGGPNECEHGYAAGIPCPHCQSASAPQPTGVAMSAIKSICEEFIEARRHGQQKYGGSDPVGHDLSHTLREWWGFIWDHVERARPERPNGNYGMTLEEREHLVKAAGLILSSIWCADVKAKRIALNIPTDPGVAMRMSDAEAANMLRNRNYTYAQWSTVEDLLEDRAEMMVLIAQLKQERDDLHRELNRLALSAPPDGKG